MSQDKQWRKKTFFRGGTIETIREMNEKGYVTTTIRRTREKKDLHARTIWISFFKYF